eukprot:scaffold28745_cov18-Tisochrysis_lutea.AAC.1
MSGRALNVRLDAGPQEASGELAAKRAATDMSAYGGGMSGMAGTWSRRTVAIMGYGLHGQSVLPGRTCPVEWLFYGSDQVLELRRIMPAICGPQAVFASQLSLSPFCAQFSNDAKDRVLTFKQV